METSAGKPAGATVGELSENPDLRAVVQATVDRANTAVSRAEGIKRSRLLPGRFRNGRRTDPPRKDPQGLCPGQVRRVLAKYAADAEALYA